MKLYVIDTNYPTDIGVPRNMFQQPDKAIIRGEFIGKAKKLIPKEAQNFPNASIGLSRDGEEIWGYFVDSNAVNIYSSFFQSRDKDGKAKELDDVLKGEDRAVKGLWKNGNVLPICHLVNTAMDHYNYLFKILKEKFDYELIRFQVNK